MMGPRTSALITFALHVATIILGGVATALTFLGDIRAAGVVTIAITTTGAIGVYASAPSTSP